MYTTIIHPIRKALALSLNEYCVLDTVYRLSQNVRYGGWCVASRSTLAKDLDLSERSIFNVIETLIEKDLVEKNELGHLRSKDTWNELISNSNDYYIAFNGKESKFVSGVPFEPQTAKFAPTVQKVPMVGAKSSDGVVQNLHTTISSNNEKDKKTGERSLRFAVPQLEEVKSYCLERKTGVDPEAFWNFYESKGWKVGSAPMRSWKAAIVTWEKRNKGNFVPPARAPIHYPRFSLNDPE